jgi:hypothetical protein
MRPVRFHIIVERRLTEGLASVDTVSPVVSAGRRHFPPRPSTDGLNTSELRVSLRGYFDAGASTFAEGYGGQERPPDDRRAGHRSSGP